MTIIARVEEIKDSLVRAKFFRDAECGSCTHCTLGKEKQETSVEARNLSALPLKIGDTVEISLSPWKSIKAGFLILIMPLLLFFVLYLFGKHLLGIDSETANIFLGISGIAIGFLINILIKRFQSRPDLPEITRIVESGARIESDSPDDSKTEPGI